MKWAYIKMHLQKFPASSCPPIINFSSRNFNHQIGILAFHSADSLSIKQQQFELYLQYQDEIIKNSGSVQIPNPQKKCHPLQELHRYCNGNSLIQSKISSIQPNNKNNHYDYTKYYSSKCQNYLRSIKFDTSQNLPYPNDHNERIKTTESCDSLQSILKTQQKKNTQINEIKIEQMTFKKLQFVNNRSQNNKVDPQRQITQVVQDFNELDLNTNNEIQSTGERKQCPICGRKFIESSFEKHIKICQKVFIKKRKPFSSEKQRSQSKDKK